MKGKIAAGIIAGLLAATALVGVVAVSYNAGRDDAVVHVVDNGETTTRVVEVTGRGWHGPGLFGLLVPVLLIVLVVAFLTRRRRWGWRHGYGPWGPGAWGTGAWGPGPWGSGPCPPGYAYGPAGAPPSGSDAPDNPPPPTPPPTPTPPGS